MKEIIDKIHSLLLTTLTIESPVLSGNMKSFIEEVESGKIVIKAPFYDMNKWKKEKVIVHTGAVINGRTDYSEWVNRLGAFGTHNKSENWVNRAIFESVSAIANEIGATVINELPL